jgi:hypothetical protein
VADSLRESALNHEGTFDDRETTFPIQRRLSERVGHPFRLATTVDHN